MNNSDQLEPSRCGGFVGRERELAELLGGFDEVLSGVGRTFLVSGEPGVGKTRFADEFCSRVRRGRAQIIWGRCEAAPGAPPYWPMIQVLRACAERPNFTQLAETLGGSIRHVAPLVPEIIGSSHPYLEKASAPGESGQERFKLFDAVATLLKSLARHQPMVLVIDDLHEADLPSVQMLRFVSRTLKDSPVLLVGTYRNAEVTRSPELAQLIDELGREASTIPLGCLSRTEVAHFVRAMSRREADDSLVHDVYQATDGNPLFVDGVVRLMLAESPTDLAHGARVGFKIPAGVRESIRRRQASLPDQTRAILSAAAVVGSEFELAILERVLASCTDEIVESLTQAESLGVISQQPTFRTRYRFAHALIRDVVYEDIGAIERSRLHCNVAKAIEELYTGALDPRLPALAYHFRMAGAFDKALDYSIRAGETAYGLFAYEDAAANWRDALALIKEHGADPERQAKVLSLLGDELVSGPAKSISYLEAVLPLASAMGQSNEVAQLHSRLGLLWTNAAAGIFNMPRAMSHLTAAEALLKEQPPSPAQLLVYIGMAAAYGWALQSRAALKEIDRAIQLSAELGSDGAWAITAVMRATSLAALGRIGEGQALVEEARARCEQLNDGMAGSTVAWLGGDFFAYLWDPETAIAWYNRELANPRTAQSSIRCTKLRRRLLAARVLAGDLDQARTLLAENELNECVVTDDLDEVESLALKYPLGALLIFFEGDWQLAEQQFRKTLQATHRAGVLSCECNVRYRLGWLLRVDNRLSEAEPILEDGIAPCLAGPDQESEIQLRQGLVSLLCEQSRLSEAKAHLERLHEITAGGEDWRGLGGAVEHTEALVHAVEGNLDLAGADFSRAVATFRRYAMRWEEAETLRDWGITLIAAGESICGAAKLNEAAQIYRRCGGGQRWIDRVMAAMPAQPSPAGEEVPFEKCVQFVRDGDYWTLTFEGKTSRLREAKGLRYIAILLAQPGEEIRALDLVSRVNGVTREIADSPASMDLSRAETLSADLGHAGEALDAQAKTAYKCRRAELMDEIEEAREFGNEEQARKAEDEIEALTRELKGAIGLAGRDRRAASSSERARIAVTRAIRLSLDKIDDNNAALGKLLSTTIKTGTVCAYVPDDRFPVSWRL